MEIAYIDKCFTILHIKHYSHNCKSIVFGYNYEWQKYLQ